MIELNITTAVIDTDGDRTLIEVKVNGQRTGFVETRGRGDKAFSFALGDIGKTITKTEAKKRFAAKVDRQAPKLTVARPKVVDPEQLFRPAAKSQNPGKGVRRQGGRRDRKPIELHAGNLVIGYVVKTLPEKGYSFFCVVGRLEGDVFKPFSKNEQPQLFVHDRSVPESLINDLDDTSLQTYQIEVRSGNIPGRLEGKVTGLDDTVELKEAA